MTIPPRNFAKRGRDKGTRCQQHRAWIRKHLCIAWARHECEGRVECCHVRDVAPNGHGGGKPGDEWSVGMCRRHHRESEKREEAWGQEMGIDVRALAIEYAQRSPSRKIREAMAAYHAQLVIA